MKGFLNNGTVHTVATPPASLYREDASTSLHSHRSIEPGPGPEFAFQFEIGSEGDVAELNNQQRRQYSSEIAELTSYARGLLRSDLDVVRFILASDPAGWLAVCLRADRDRLPAPRVVAEVQGIKPPFGLTLRQLDLLTMLAAGFSNETIAARLTISPRTVAKHIENIFEKTEIWSRAGLAGMAVDNGLLRLPVPGEGRVFPLGIGTIEALSRSGDAPGRSARRGVQPPIRIGMPLARHDRGSADALEMLNGAQLAVRQINERGGVLNRRLEILPVDYDLSCPQSVADALSALIDQEVAAITFGYSCENDAIMQLVSEYKAPFLHASTMERVVERVRDDPTRYGNVFQVCASDVKYGAGLARYISSLIETHQWRPRNRRIVILQPPWPGQDIGLTQLDMRLGGPGWQIEIVPVADTKNDWNMTLDRLHQLDPAVIVLASYFVEDSIDFHRAFSARPIPALLYKLYSPSIPVYQQTLGASAEGVLWATTTGLYHDVIAESFVRQYRQAYSRSPGQSHASISYDRINLLAGAWSRTGNFFQFDKVVGDLRSNIYRGVNGAYYLGTKGQVGLSFPHDTSDPSISQAHLIFQIQDGEQRIVSPHPYADARFRLPAWCGGET